MTDVGVRLTISICCVVSQKIEGRPYLESVYSDSLFHNNICLSKLSYGLSKFPIKLVRIVTAIQNWLTLTFAWG